MTSNKTVIELEAAEVYVEKFNRFSKKSTEAVIEMGRVVNAAQALKDDEYEHFCAGIRFKKESKALVKLQSIGKKADVLLKYAHMLPSNWTTLYLLSRLNESQLSELADQGKLQVNMLGSEAQLLVDTIFGKRESSKQNQAAAEETSNSVDRSYALSIQFAQTPSHDDIVHLKSLVDEYSKRADCSVSLTSVLEELIEQLEISAESEA